MTSLIERELSRTQFKSMVVMVWHVVEEVCKDEAVQILGVKKYDTMFWCMVYIHVVAAKFARFATQKVLLILISSARSSALLFLLFYQMF